MTLPHAGVLFAKTHAKKKKKGNSIASERFERQRCDVRCVYDLAIKENKKKTGDHAQQGCR